MKNTKPKTQSASRISVPNPQKRSGFEPVSVFLQSRRKMREVLGIGGVFQGK